MQAGKGDAIYSETKFFGGKNGIYTLPTPTKWNMLSYNSVVCSALYRKSEWEKYGGYDQACAVCGCEDWDFWLDFMADGKRFYKIDQVLFYDRQQEVSRNAGARQMENQQILFAHFKRKFKSLYYRYYLPKRLAEKALRFVYQKKRKVDGTTMVKLFKIPVYYSRGKM